MWNPFDTLSNVQDKRLREYERLLLKVNKQFNLISASDQAHVWERHILHSLALSRRDFPVGSVVVDWGTGGGLPAIPLAIRFPEVTVHAVDAVRKKIQAVRMMARRLGLDNLHTWHGRAEEWPGDAHYSVSRATAPLETLWAWHERIAQKETPPSGEQPAWKPGLLCLKGGALHNEISMLRTAFPDVTVETHDLHAWLGRPHFEEKVLLHMRRDDSL